MKNKLKSLKGKKETIFAQDANLFKRYERVLENEVRIDAQKRGELITQLIELYSSIIQQRTQTNQKIDMMMRVLKQKAQSNLVPPLWNGVKRFIPDMIRFVGFLATPGLLQESVTSTQTSLMGWFAGLLAQPMNLIFALLALIALIIVYMFLYVVSQQLQ